MVNAYSCICYSDDQQKFVAAGASKTCISSDGVTWTNYTSLSGSISGIIWVSKLSKYVGVGTNTVFLSSNGINFTNIDVSGINSGFVYQRVAYSSTLGGANGRLVAVGNLSGNGRVIYSDDGGNTWTNATIPKTNVPWRGIAYSEVQKKFVVVAGSGSGNQRVMTSVDGINWSLYYDGGGNCNWHEVLYVSNHNMWVAVGPGNYGHVMVSNDGMSWTLGNANQPGAQNAATYSPELDRFVGVGDGYSYPWIMTSPPLYTNYYNITL